MRKEYAFMKIFNKIDAKTVWGIAGVVVAIANLVISNKNQKIGQDTMRKEIEDSILAKLNEKN